jgi:hypothetical protein
MKNSLLHFASSLSLPANYITKPHKAGQLAGNVLISIY